VGLGVGTSGAALLTGGRDSRQPESIEVKISGGEKVLLCGIRLVGGGKGGGRFKKRSKNLTEGNGEKRRGTLGNGVEVIMTKKNLHPW